MDAPLILILFLSRHGVRARMASALFNSMAERRRATSRACSVADPHRVPELVERLMEELDVSAAAQPVEQLTLPATASIGSIVTLGPVDIDVPPALWTQWPALELDSRAETVRAIRDDLSACIVMWVAREGWVDSTERHTR